MNGRRFFIKKRSRWWWAAAVADKFSKVTHEAAARFPVGAFPRKSRFCLDDLTAGVLNVVCPCPNCCQHACHPFGIFGCPGSIALFEFPSGKSNSPFGPMTQPLPMAKIPPWHNVLYHIMPTFYMCSTFTHIFMYVS